MTRAGALIAVLVLCGACQHEPPAPVVRDQLHEMTATVEAVYLPTRMVVLRGEGGGTAALMVGPEVQNLDQVNVGDRVVVSYYEGVAAEVAKPGEGDSSPEATQEIVRAPRGERPAGAIGQSVTATVAVESVDTSFNTVTFRRPDGLERTVAVQSEEGREFIRKLRRGDQIRLTYTEALAVQVKPTG